MPPLMLFGKGTDTCMRTREVLNALTYIDVLEQRFVGHSKVAENVVIGSATNDGRSEKEAE